MTTLDGPTCLLSATSKRPKGDILFAHPLDFLPDAVETGGRGGEGLKSDSPLDSRLLPLGGPTYS